MTDVEDGVPSGPRSRGVEENEGRGADGPRGATTAVIPSLSRNPSSSPTNRRRIPRPARNDALSPTPRPRGHPVPDSPTIVARAPLRISFGGGGTDLPAYFQRHGGFVVSTAIDRACTVVANPSPDGAIGINSADYRRWTRLDPADPVDLAEPLSLPKAAAAWFLRRGALRDGVELFLASEVAPGSGLGSSSAMAVALVRALAEHAGWQMTPAEVAGAACEIELDLLARPIGKQDQFAASFGGLNAIAFAADGVTVTPLSLPPGTAEALEARLLLCSTGACRDSASILGEQRARTGSDPATADRLHRLKELAWTMRDALLAGDLDRFGALLDQGWQIKRGLTDRVSSGAIDRLYGRARSAGALGGKITGAGGGGFLLLYVSDAKRERVVGEMVAAGLQPLVFRLSPSGATAARVTFDDRAVAAGLPATARGGV